MITAGEKLSLTWDITETSWFFFPVLKSKLCMQLQPPNTRHSSIPMSKNIIHKRASKQKACSHANVHSCLIRRNHILQKKLHPEKIEQTCLCCDFRSLHAFAGYENRTKKPTVPSGNQGLGPWFLFPLVQTFVSNVGMKRLIVQGRRGRAPILRSAMSSFWLFVLAVDQSEASEAFQISNCQQYIQPFSGSSDTFRSLRAETSSNFDFLFFNSVFNLMCRPSDLSLLFTRTNQFQRSSF